MAFAADYVYHIKDEYFKKVKDDKLMKNKENGNYRPTFLCFEDSRISGLYWVVPMSIRIEKYQEIYDKQISKYGNCITIMFGKFDGKESAFLLQNLFPITAQYISHVHTKNGNPIPINPVLAQQVKSNVKRILNIYNTNKQIVFPNIGRLRVLMLEELKNKDFSLQARTPPNKLNEQKSGLLATKDTNAKGKDGNNILNPDEMVEAAKKRAVQNKSSNTHNKTALQHSFAGTSNDEPGL